MNRRSLFQLICATMPISVIAAPANAATADASKVVYHLADLDKVDFVLGNISNHFKGVGGPEYVTIALVVHGPALKAFHTADASPDMSQRTGDIVETDCSSMPASTPCARRTLRSRICCRASSSPTRAAWCGSPICSRRALSICGRSRAHSSPVKSRRRPSRAAE